MIGSAHFNTGAHMPVHVTMWMLSGKRHQRCLKGSQTVRDIKAILSHHFAVKTWRIQLLTPPGHLCDEEASLIDLVDCPLTDVLDPKAQKNVMLELDLHVVVSSAACSVCEADFARRCAGCRLTRYCSRACQLQDWRRHKTHCKARAGHS